MKKRLISIAVIAALLGGVIGIGKLGLSMEKKEKPLSAEVLALSEAEESSQIIEETTYDKDTVYIWYTDDALTSYLNSAAVAYSEETGIRIVPQLKSGIDYLESINRTSIESNAPDLFVLSNDALERAYLAGLASEIDPQGIKEVQSFSDVYMDKGVKASSYDGKVIGYPFYFETSVILFNRTYIRDMAENDLITEAIAEAAEKEAEEAKKATPTPKPSATPTATPTPTPTPTATPTPTPTATKNPDATATPIMMSTPSPTAEPTATPTATPPLYVFSEEEITERMESLLPRTMEQITTFSDQFDAPAQVESVFCWDVTDILYNYFFVGNSISIGGEEGWDPQQVDIYNEEAIRAFQHYQDLNNFFSMETKSSDYDGIIADFIDGKIVFTVVTSDALMTLENAKADGSFVYEYGIMETPALKEGENASSLSITNSIAINGYSTHKAVANDFAYFLTTKYNDILFTHTGKLSAAKNVQYENGDVAYFIKEYETSTALPKMIETSNYWVLLETAFAEIWNGADPNEQLKALSEQIMRQITGEEYEEEYIEIQDETEEIEYLDEDFYRQEAQETADN